MNKTKPEIRQCCKNAPVWIFVYSDGRIYAICDEDYHFKAYRYDVKFVINIKSKISQTAKEAFGNE